MAATATTELAFTGAVLPTSGFRVQVKGVDPWGKGPYHTDLESALAYATAANGNGHSCIIHLT